MTTVITRYFDSAANARLAKEELVNWRSFSLRIIDLYDKPEGLAETLAAEHVEAETARAYEARMANGGAVLLVRAGFKPLSVAKTTRQVTAEMGAADMGGVTEEVYVKDELRPMLSVLDDHPHFMFRPRDPSSTTYYMANWPIPLISRRKPATGSLFARHARMADFLLPLTIRREPYSGSIFPKHARMANFPIPLINRREPFTGSIFPRHARMANFPIPLISRRKPYTGSIIPRHGRMATVPFPLLINGKTGRNALIPDGPRMANFPISLLSSRKPFTGSIFPRHARMANFPIPLISRREPFTGSAFPRHARMANFPIPLVVPRDGENGFSFSKLLGLPTLSRRPAH